MSIKLVNSDGDTLMEIKGHIKGIKNNNNTKHHKINVYDDKNKKPRCMDIMTYARMYDINPPKLYRHLNKCGFMYDEQNRKYLESLKEKSHIL